MEETVELSSAGELPLPEHLREDDQLAEHDRFRLHRLSRGRYLLEKIEAAPAKAELVRSRSGFLVFRGPADGPPITQELVKRLESETL